MHKNQQKSMELEGGGHESCTPTGGRWNMATRADVHAGKCRSVDGQAECGVVRQNGFNREGVSVGSQEEHFLMSFRDA